MIGGSVQDLRIPTPAATADFEDRARFFIRERAQESELLRPTDLVWELNVDARERRKRQGSSRKEEDGQMAEGRGSWKTERALRGRDDGGRSNQDGAGGQQDAEEGGRRRRHFLWDGGFVCPDLFCSVFRVLDGCTGRSNIETKNKANEDGH